MELRLKKTIPLWILLISLGSAAEAAPKTGCFEATYKAANAPQESGVNWVHQFEVGQINPASICVRANGLPARFKLKKNSLLVSGISPQDQVVIRYCVGHSQCKESCPAPKDESFRALATEKLVDPIPDASAQESSFDGRVAAIENRARSRKIEYSLFKNWVRQGETAVCQPMKKGK